jgi:hypothetical protein
VGGEAVGTDPGAVAHAAFDHNPTHESLRGAQGDHHQQTAGQAGADHPLSPEIQKGKQEHQPDEPGPGAVDVLPPENALELLQREISVLFVELGVAPVIVKGALPGLFTERRQGALDRLPGGHGKAGIGQARDAAYGHLNQHHQNADPEPDSDRARGKGDRALGLHGALRYPGQTLNGQENGVQNPILRAAGHCL